MELPVIEKVVFIESPFKGENWELVARNIYYARLCVKDSLSRREAPYASHLFFTQAAVLNDLVQSERELGIAAGQAIGDLCHLRAVYQDFGITKGMQYGVERALRLGQPIEYRKLSATMDLDKALSEMAKAKPFIDLGGLLF